MALTTGSRQAVGVAVGWALAAIGTAVSIAYFSEIRTATRTVLGVSEPTAARISASSRERQTAREAAPVSAGRTVELKAEAYGHFHASAEINGRPINVMVDTGASIVA